MSRPRENIITGQLEPGSGAGPSFKAPVENKGVAPSEKKSAEKKPPESEEDKKKRIEQEKRDKAAADWKARNFANSFYYKGWPRWRKVDETKEDKPGAEHAGPKGFTDLLGEGLWAREDKLSNIRIRVKFDKEGMIELTSEPPPTNAKERQAHMREQMLWLASARGKGTPGNPITICFPAIDLNNQAAVLAQYKVWQEAVNQAEKLGVAMKNDPETTEKMIVAMRGFVFSIQPLLSVTLFPVSQDEFNQYLARQNNLMKTDADANEHAKIMEGTYVEEELKKHIDEVSQMDKLDESFKDGMDGKVGEEKLKAIEEEFTKIDERIGKLEEAEKSLESNQAKVAAVLIDDKLEEKLAKRVKAKSEGIARKALNALNIMKSKEEKVQEKIRPDEVLKKLHERIEGYDLKTIDDLKKAIQKEREDLADRRDFLQEQLTKAEVEVGVQADMNKSPEEKGYEGLLQEIQGLENTKAELGGKIQKLEEQMENFEALKALAGRLVDGDENADQKTGEKLAAEKFAAQQDLQDAKGELKSAQEKLEAAYKKFENSTDQKALSTAKKECEGLEQEKNKENEALSKAREDIDALQKQKKENPAVDSDNKQEAGLRIKIAEAEKVLNETDKKLQKAQEGLEEKKEKINPLEKQQERIQQIRKDKLPKVEERLKAIDDKLKEVDAKREEIVKNVEKAKVEAETKRGLSPSK